MNGSHGHTTKLTLGSKNPSTDLNKNPFFNSMSLWKIAEITSAYKKFKKSKSLKLDWMDALHCKLKGATYR